MAARGIADDRLRPQKLASQRREVQRYINAHGLTDVKWFTDKATGTNIDRPGFTQLQTAIGKRQVKTVVVWKLDRAFRNALDCQRTVEEWDRLGVSLRIIDLGGQPIDTRAAAGKFMLTVVAAVAEMETTNRRERQRAGIEAARARGVRWGGSKPGWRWRVTDDQVRAITQMVDQGEPIAKVARITGLSRPTVYRCVAQ